MTILPLYHVKKPDKNGQSNDDPSKVTPSNQKDAEEGKFSGWFMRLAKPKASGGCCGEKNR